MPIANSTYSRGRKAKVKGRVEKAAENKMRYSRTRYTIRFYQNGLEFQKETQKG